MHHILQEHSQGIKFREWNAGTQIDGQMRSEGFDVEIRLDKQTGFMHGGNAHNCGTWMDKMGSAPQNKGQPATSRDGAPIELVAMQYSVLRFMQDLADDGIIDTHIVSLENGEEWTYKHWADRIQENFERCFWVPLTREEDPNFDIKANLVNRRGIYKDVYRPSQAYTEYQLRPNLCVAMSYAPELFKPDRARQCLQTVEVVLLEKGCMGMKTLDPSDKNYRGDYINSDDSHGWNYH
jgi:glycogen debranching enzyme